jgi:hypothetical protein
MRGSSELDTGMGSTHDGMSRNTSRIRCRTKASSKSSQPGQPHCPILKTAASSDQTYRFASHKVTAVSAGEDL